MTPDRRPSLGPPPPVGGAALAVRTAVRRRRARRWAAAGTASLAALAVGAVVAVGGGGTAALDTEPRDLDSATEPTGSPEPTPTAETSPVPSEEAAASASAAPSGGDDPSGEPGSDDPRADGEVDPQPTSAADPSYRTPDMRRTSAPMPRPTGGPTGPVFCGGSVSGSGEEQVDGQVGWCVEVAAEPTGSGHVFSLRICHDDSGDGRLSFPSSRETEMVVRRGDAVVWRWSADHPERDEPHALAVAAGQCFTWSLDYTDVDQGGGELPAGTYVLTAGTTAAELDTGGDGTAEFVLA